jgi:DNA primase small subunit
MGQNHSIPTSSSAGVDTDVMLAFYQRLFPFRYIFQWLNHDIVPTSDFGNREFALTLQNDAYLRYQSYATADLYVF